MKLEQQVTSLEISKRLCELGIPQESLFYWQQSYSEMKGGQTASGFEITQKKRESKKGLRCFSAFTVAELDNLLPQIIEIDRIKYQVFVSMAIDRQFFGVYVDENDYHSNAHIPFMMCHNGADARGKMLIYLLENNLLTHYQN